MKRSYKGSCPPWLAIGLVAFWLVVVFCLTMFAWATPAFASNVVPGSEVAPPGGATYTPPPATEAPTEPPVIDTPPVINTPPVIVTEEPIETPPVTEEPEPSFEVSFPPEPEPDAVGTYPSRVDTSGISIVSPSLDALLAEGADLEKLLYPSGLKLPTKYMDLLMCAPYTSSVPVTGEVAFFLKTIAPSETGTYTYAEYSAAVNYLALCRLYVQPAGTTATADSAQSLDKNTSLNWMQNITSATLSNSQRLVGLISTYRDILEQAATGADISRHAQYRDIVADHRGVHYSCGDLSTLSDIAQGLVLNDAEAATYVLSLYSWWDYIGVSHSLTSAILEYSTFYDEFAYNGINFNHGAPVASVSSGGSQGTSGLRDPDPEVSGGTEVQGPNEDPGGSGGTPGIVSGSTGGNSGWTQPNPSTPDNPVSSVSTGGTASELLPEGKRNLKEVASIAAGIFVFVAIVALWAIKSYRKGHDPLFRNWNK